ncbi:L2 family extended-spectrum class A beta-lactamase [Stenotrophomonas rhizophila]|uniref:L2 family extended-spectrum class A beta-lactamase n=1 Tax=Stenotrophomonas rhizophila TaxID=216778 RepID=UPI001E5E6474|nr:L2 family extended-spectrum class A beta-lactamase [Stenotrophomonas rhizophila]MCC7632527.1 L2 family class A beta-lactamase [Stenotrophomonas rhizophila]MCC7663379.1 L2 family class A beta-lactamase [Stenotrophomonas rhizophila]
MLARRQFLQWTGAAAASALAASAFAKTPAVVAAARPAAGDFATLEAASGGRLGVTLLDTGSGMRIGHRQDERFPMCSTFKFVLCAAVLRQVEQGRLALDQRIAVRAQDMIAHAPVSSRHVGKDLSVRDLCRATMVTSDNPAANLLLGVVGGPAGVTAFLRANGDAVTRNDRIEPEMNRFAPGDPRDTTSPAAMAASLQRFVLGDVLKPASKQQLADWLIDNETGDARLRAGLSKAWRVGDKTGSNGKDTTNDIAILWPLAGGAPWVLTSYLQGATVDDAGRNDVLRQVAVIAEGIMRSAR